MKLYQAPRFSYLKIIDNDIIVAPMSCPLNYDIIYFDNIDGMFSVCKDIEGNIIKLAAWTKVKVTDKKKFEAQLINKNETFLKR